MVVRIFAMGPTSEILYPKLYFLGVSSALGNIDGIMIALEDIEQGPNLAGERVIPD